MSKNNEKLMEVIAKVLDLEASTITDDMSPENTSTWDSFNALMMISELETQFNVHFSMEEVYLVTCVADIRKALKHHDIDFG